MRKLALLLALLPIFGPAVAQTDKDSAAAPVQKTADVITQPEFKGGIEKMYEYINRNFQYPEEAQRRNFWRKAVIIQHCHFKGCAG